jgi:hypothetical protein
MRSLSLHRYLAAAVVAAFTVAGAAEELTFGGMGWVQYGRVVHSTDTSQSNYNGNSVQSTGAQISMRLKASETFEGAVGIGVQETHFLSGANRGGRVPMTLTPYIAEASFTYSFWNDDNAKLRLRGGLFPYNYNPDVKNLGLYLLRGPVHPGIVISGFETKPVLPIANTLGFQLHHQTGAFQQDFILNSETDLYPFFDVSPAYVAHYQAGSVLRIGGGVNFYRYLSVESKLTSPDYLSPTGRDQSPDGPHPYRRSYIYVDTAGMGAGGAGDTTFISFRGIKLMADASFDPKPLFGSPEILGAEDLKIYSEVALLGIENNKAYNEIYGDYLHRMPVMVGFNLPAFKWLDVLSMEVEWYGAKFRDDLFRYQTGRSYYPSPLPVSGSTSYPGEGSTLFDYEKNQKRDNWKWSLYGSKTIEKHFKVSGQVANDHFRPGGVVGNPSQEAILSTPKDWYWMAKIAYFF